MPEQAICINHIPDPPNTRLVVGKGGPGIDADLQQLCLTKSGVQGVGRIHQFHDRAQGSAVPLACFNLGGTQHEHPVAARHNIKWKPWVKQPNGPRQRDIRAAHHKHLAFDAAQIRQRVTRRKAAAVNCLTCDLIAKTHALFRKPRMQSRQGRARVKMPLICQKERLAPARRPALSTGWPHLAHAVQRLPDRFGLG